MSRDLGTTVALFSRMDDDDTDLTPAPVSENRERGAVAWADTDRSVPAQAPSMSENTGVEPWVKESDSFMITFRRPVSVPDAVNFAEASRIDWDDEPTGTIEVTPQRIARADTSGEWPPPPREPAPTRESRVRRAAVFAVVSRPETNN
jgi:hypothetical protein